MARCLVPFSPFRAFVVAVVPTLMLAAGLLASVSSVVMAANDKKPELGSSKAHAHIRTVTASARIGGPKDVRASKGGVGGRQKAKKPHRKVATKVPVLPPARGKVAVFVFKGDDTTSERVRAQVVRAFRARGMKVVTTLRPVDSAEQFREMAVTLDLAVYVDGEVNEDGDQASATVHVRSGVTGLRVASATFSGEQRKLPADVGKALWTEVGDAVARICADAAKPRKHDRAPMRIEAGTPIENTPPEGT